MRKEIQIQTEDGIGSFHLSDGGVADLFYSISFSFIQYSQASRGEFSAYMFIQVPKSENREQISS